MYSIRSPGRALQKRGLLLTGAQNLLINTLGGKYNRGMTIPDTARIILGKEVLDKEEYDLARILGWCVELVCGLVSGELYCRADG